MQHILVRHLTGPRAGTVESFRADSGREITLGPNPAATIRFDPRLDAVVSHQHSRMVTQRALVLWVELVQFASRNGTARNQRWLRGRMALRPGDRIRLGPGGPELEFQADGAPNPP